MARKSLLSEGKKESNQCAWNDHGYQCQNDGHMTQSVVGGGPWYCRKHYAQLMGWPEWTAPGVDNSPAALDARVNKRVPRKAGESEHDWSMRCRDWALTKIKRGVLRHQLEREPGEDREEAA